jgi:fermentation-respiration switch protein FrsA (DUF1100 family)
MRAFCMTLIAISVVYGGLILLLFLFQGQLVHVPNLPSRELTATPADIGLDYQSIYFTTEDDIKLHGWFLPAQQPRKTLLFFHGNAGNISHRLTSLAIFNSLKLNVFIFDYRGYGRSTGKPSEQGLYRDAQAALDYLQKSRGLSLKEMVFFGRSLGGAVATWLAVQHPPHALIIESSFTSIPDLAAELYPFIPVRWLARLRYDTQSHLKALCSPLLIIHSSNDEIVPFAHGQSLFRTAQGAKQFLEIDGDHNSGYLTSGQKYVETLKGFLDFSATSSHANCTAHEQIH